MKVSQNSSQHSKTTLCAVCLLCGPPANLLHAQRLIYEKIAIGSKPLAPNVPSSSMSSSSSNKEWQGHHDSQGNSMQTNIPDLRYNPPLGQQAQGSYAPSSHPSSLLPSSFNPNYSTNSPSGQQSSTYSTAPPPSTQPPHGQHQNAYHQHSYNASNLPSSSASNNHYYSSGNQQMGYDYRQQPQGLLSQGFTQPQPQYQQPQKSAYGSPIPSTVPPNSSQTANMDDNTSKRTMGLLSYNSLYSQIPPNTTAPNTQPPSSATQNQYYGNTSYAGDSNRKGY